MKKAILCILMCLFIITGLHDNVLAQVTISTPQLTFQSNKVIIQYDILNSNSGDKFNIHLDVTDEKGQTINANSLSGDYGSSVSGGRSKTIVWNIGDDNLEFDELLSFRIKAETEQSTAASNNSNTTRAVNTSESMPSISRGGAVFRSILFPGLGLTKLKHGPHWLKGIVGYGCLAGGVYFYTAYSSTYSNYINSNEDPDARNKLYNSAVQQSTISNTLLLSAAGVWTIDMIWTIVGSKNKSPIASMGLKKGLSVQPSFQSEWNAPVMTFRYTF